MPSTDPRPTKNQRREEARAKALALKQEQERRARRNRIVAISGLAVAVVALVAVVVGVVRQGQETAAMYGDVVYGSADAEVTAPALADVTSPAVADETGGIPVSAAGIGTAGEDDVVVSVYFDFMCPYCGLFDEANGAELERLSAEEGVTVLYKPLSFLDGQSKGAAYSTRAANAFAVVADEDPENAVAFLTALYENQPEEGTTGLTDAEIADLAVEVGVPEAVTEGFTTTVEGTYETADGEQTGTWRTFAPFVAGATAQASTELGGSLGTPTVLIDGTKWEGDLYTTGPLTAAIEEAVAAQG